MSERNNMRVISQSTNSDVLLHSPSIPRSPTFEYRNSPSEYNYASEEFNHPLTQNSPSRFDLSSAHLSPTFVDPNSPSYFANQLDTTLVSQSPLACPNACYSSDDDDDDDEEEEDSCDDSNIPFVEANSPMCHLGKRKRSDFDLVDVSGNGEASIESLRDSRICEQKECIPLSPLMKTVAETLGSLKIRSDDITAVLRYDKSHRDSVLSKYVPGPWIDPRHFGDYMFCKVNRLEEIKETYTGFKNQLDVLIADYKRDLLDFYAPLLRKINELWHEYYAELSKFHACPSGISIFLDSNLCQTIAVEQNDSKDHISLTCTKDRVVTWSLKLKSPSLTLEKLSELSCKELERHLRPYSSLVINMNIHKQPGIEMALGEELCSEYRDISKVWPIHSIYQRFCEFDRSFPRHNFISEYELDMQKAFYEGSKKTMYLNVHMPQQRFHKYCLVPLSSLLTSAISKALDSLNSIQSQLKSLGDLVSGSASIHLDEEENNCPLCLEPIRDAARVLDCGHIVCINCAFVQKVKHNLDRCSVCRTLSDTPFWVPVVSSSGSCDYADSIEYSWGPTIARLYDMITSSSGQFLSTLVICDSQDFVSLVSRFMEELMGLEQNSAKETCDYPVYPIADDHFACATPKQFLVSHRNLPFQRVLFISDQDHLDYSASVTRLVLSNTPGRIEVIQLFSLTE